MSKICWKCGQKIGLMDNKNRFLERKSGKKIWLHNTCYLELTNDEKKKISYDIKAGPPKGLRKNLKLEGFVFGIAGGLGYSEGAFSGTIWVTKRILKKKGMSFEELDDICIDRYNYHFPILPEKLQNEILYKINHNEKI